MPEIVRLAVIYRGQTHADEHASSPAGSDAHCFCFCRLKSVRQTCQRWSKPYPQPDNSCRGRSACRSVELRHRRHKSCVLSAGRAGGVGAKLKTVNISCAPPCTERVALKPLIDCCCSALDFLDITLPILTDRGGPPLHPPRRRSTGLRLEY